MYEDGYKITNQNGVYFLTCTVWQWVNVFTRKEYKNVIVESLRFCQQQKGLQLYGWVIMDNHLHFIAGCTHPYQLSDMLRDFKKYTASKIVKEIEQNTAESRKTWLLWLLKKEKDIHFWRPDNHPEEIKTQSFFLQKLNYIYQNPVKAAIVAREEDYIYSSASKSGYSMLEIREFDGLFSQ